MSIPCIFRRKKIFLCKNQKKVGLGIADSKIIPTFALAKTKWEVLYGQLLVNPPGLDRSKGSRS
jgi:hypothetical protein